MMGLPDDIEPRDIGAWLNRGVYLVRTSDEDMVPCEFVGYEGGRVVSRALLDRRVLEPRKKDVFVHWPAGGSVNARHPDGRVSHAVYATRLKRRQYTRTLRPDMLSMSVPDRWEVRRVVGAQMTVGPFFNSIVAELFDPRYPGLIEATELHDRGVPTVAISRRLIYGRNQSVYYNGDFVGYMEGGMFVSETTEELERRVNKLLDKAR